MFGKHVVSVLGLFCLSCALTLQVQAAPKTILIQGKLTGAAGRPLSGLRAWKVQFYDAPTSGTALGGSLNGTTAVSATGRFAIEVTPPAGVLAASGPVYYSLGIDSAATPDGAIGTGDMFPERIKIASILWSFKTGDADTLDGLHGRNLVTTPTLAAGLAGKSNTTHGHGLGTLSGQVTDAQVPDTITIDRATSATYAGRATTATLALWALGADRATSATHADAATTATVAMYSPMAGDADMVDGQHAAAFAGAGHGHQLDQLEGAVTDDQVPDTITINEAAHANSADRATSSTHADQAATASNADRATTATVALDTLHAGNAAFSAYGDLAAEGYLDNTSGNSILTRLQGDARYATTNGDTTLTGNLTVDNWTFHVNRASHAVGIGTTAPGGLLQAFSTNMQLDAKYDGGTNGGGSNAPDKWQSFKALTTGRLAKVSFHCSGNTNVIFKIYAGSGMGGTLLASQPVSINSSFNWFDVVLNQPVFVTAGTQYTWAVSNSSAMGFAVFWGNAYTDGDSSLTGFGTSDILFRTYVAPHILTVQQDGKVGIGTTQPQATLHVKNVLKLEPLATAPASPTMGTIYMDSVSGKLKVFDGTIWQSCW